MLCPRCHRPLPEDAEEAYICCAGAPTRWQCRQCGKRSEGFALPYGRCPQCAGELVLCDNDEAAAALEPAALAAIRTAFEIELGGRAFYQRAAAECTDPKLRALFGRLAVMEGEHMEALARRYHVEMPDPSPAWRMEVAAVFVGAERAPRNAEELLQLAIAHE